MWLSSEEKILADRSHAVLKFDSSLISYFYVLYVFLKLTMVFSSEAAIEK